MSVPAPFPAAVNLSTSSASFPARLHPAEASARRSNDASSTSGPKADSEAAGGAPRAETADAYRMLIVDDDPEVGEALQLFFEAEGYHITRAGDGEAALHHLAGDAGFDVVLLDVMLPRKNGFEVLQEVQERGYVPPVLMISGRGEQETILRSFGLGASDYIVKPFNPDELAARVRAILGRSPAPERTVDVFAFGEVEIDIPNGAVYRSGERLKLSEVEWDILRQLVLHRDGVVTRKRLLREALGIDEEVFSFEVDSETVARTLERHITSLRTKIEMNPYEPQYLKTVYGQGYRLVVEA